MIFILDILLLLNIFICYWSFKYVFSPAFLLGGGLLAAAIVATLHYDSWNLVTFSAETVLVIGGGALWFTFVCMLLSNSKNLFISNIKRREIDFGNINIKKIKDFLFLLIGLGLLTILVRVKVYASFFGGNLNLASLIWSVREDATVGSQRFILPIYVKLPSIVNTLASYFTVWLLALQAHSKIKDRQLIRLLLLQIVVVCFDGILGGAKGGLFDPVIRFFILHILFIYYEKGTVRLPKKYLKRFLILFCVGVFSFQGLNIVMGRDVAETNSVDLFSVYCGAEMKNLDSYIQNPEQYGKSKYWGGTTFNNFYAYLGKSDNDYGARWEYIDDVFLGNVYTIFYPFHRDWGLMGVFTMLFFIALVSMLFYKKALISVCRMPTNPSFFLILYSVMASHIVMSFFSSRFTEVVFQPGFAKVMVYVLIMKQLYISFFVKKTHESKIVDGSHSYI